MSETIVQPLLDLQDTDTIIRDLERELKDLPIRRARETARLAGVSAEFEIAKKQLEAHLKRIAEEQEEALSCRDKAQQHKISSATASSNRELQQLSAEIDRLEQEADAAEARAVSLSDQTATLERDVQEAQARVDAEKGSVESFVGELDASLAEVKAQLAALEKERREKANKVPPQFLLRYERLRLKKWPVVVQLTEDNVCDGCHLVQPPSVDQQVKHNRGLVSCMMCGRILYRDL